MKREKEGREAQAQCKVSSRGGRGGMLAYSALGSRLAKWYYQCTCTCHGGSIANDRCHYVAKHFQDMGKSQMCGEHYQLATVKCLAARRLAAR